MPLTENDIRRQLADVLGTEPVGRLFDHLAEETEVAQVIEGHQGISWLAGKYLRLARTAGLTTPGDLAPEMLESEEESDRPPSASSSFNGQLHAEREEALSRAFAAYASRDPQVIGFRERYLGGRLLDPEEVHGWVKAQAEADGEPSVWVTAPIPQSDWTRADDEADEEGPGAITVRGLPRQAEWRYLRYATPGQPWASHAPIAAGGVLGRLYRLSQALAEAFAWTEAQATMFVLTGQPPRVETVAGSLGVYPPNKLSHLHNLSAIQGKATDLPPSAGLRITLEVDPALTPRQVAQFYARARRRMGAGRTRVMSAKHLRLAAFYAQPPEGETWPERMAAWNKQAPESWRYGKASIFRRDCLQAEERLLYPDFGGFKDTLDHIKWAEQRREELDG